MPQDAFTLRLVAKELNTLAGGRINRINQPEKEEVSFLIYTGKGTLKLVVNANASDCGVYFSGDDRENPLTAPNFCMLLRKYLQSAELLSADTVGFERIVRLRFRCVSDFSSCERELLVEVMGKYSNALLLENGVILGAMKTTALDENCRRVILPGAKYTLPAPQDKVNPSDFSALSALFPDAPEGDVANFLFTRVAGLAPATAEQIALSYTGGSFAKHVYDYIFSDEISPCVLFRAGKPVDFYARRVDGATPFPTLSEAQSYFYSQKRGAKRFEGGKRKLTAAVSNALKKHEKRLAQILEKQRGCAGAEELRIKGELITANLWALQKGMRACELVNYYDEAGGTKKISLDPLLSPADNAQSYFKRYRKQKRTLEALAPQETEVRAELEYLSSLSAAAESARNETDLKGVEEELLTAGLLKPPAKETRRKKAPELPFRTYECAGFQILAGRNNLQNDKLLRMSDPDDLWLHAQRYHSCHVIIRTNGRAVPDEVITYAANVCARYSDGKGDKIPVDSCKLKDVKKPPKSRLGFVVYTAFTTITGDPDAELS